MGTQETGREGFMSGVRSTRYSSRDRTSARGRDLTFARHGAPTNPAPTKSPSSVADFFQELNANLEIEAFEPSEFVTEADQVLVKSTGRMFDNRWVMALCLRDGKIKKFEEFADTQAFAVAHDVSPRAVGGVPST